ncbi:transaldolase [Nocardia sp. NBC_00511]|uniref:transaldolase n=1 Tax=Nocardia sp. NBC_00511 TaxID=2903591 RepID=UPI0030E2C57A
MIAVDHSLTTGAAGGLSDMAAVLRSVVRGGADGVVAHRGSACRQMPVQRETALVMHLSGSTALSANPELKIRVCNPETAAALGADAVSVHVTLGAGSTEDRATLADLAAVARSCDALGLPLLAMTYASGAGSTPGRSVLHAARVVAELGADIVKTAHPGDEYLAELAAGVPIPVVVAGGRPDGSWDDFVSAAKNAMGVGLAGLCVGRHVFGSADPAAATAQLKSIVHGEVAAAAVRP